MDKRVLSSEQLPFSEGSFDCVVTTITLCSIPDVRQAMAELFRVLKPKGRILFLEHGISPNANVARRITGLLHDADCHQWAEGHCQPQGLIDRPP